MFNIGDKIVYPMHGAGIIEKIEEKVILDEKREYFVVKIPVGDMKVMIPIDNIVEIGVRPVVNAEQIEIMLNVLKEDPSEMPDNWNRRYRENMELLKKGDLCDVAGVVRNLMIVDKEKGLSTGERKMLATAKQILMSELILVRGIGNEEATEIVDSAVFK